MEPASLWALTVGAIYFGSVIATGIALRKACDWLMGRVGVGLDDVQAQAGPNRGVRDAFVMGWRSKR